MRSRIKVLIAAVIVLMVFTISTITMALIPSGWMGNSAYRSDMMDRNSGDQGMMNGNAGDQEMMGGNWGYQGMMGENWGYQDMMGRYQRNTGAQGTPITGVTQLTIKNFLYQPANVQVRVGTMVTWTNQDNAPHSVTFQNGMSDSGLLSQGQSFSYTFNSPGTYHYFCKVHPSMVATMTVVS